MYQSPMGKVKNNKLCCDFIIIHRFVKKKIKEMIQKHSLILVIPKRFLPANPHKQRQNIFLTHRLTKSAYITFMSLIMLNPNLSFVTLR